MKFFCYPKRVFGHPYVRSDIPGVISKDWQLYISDMYRIVPEYVFKIRTWWNIPDILKMTYWFTLLNKDENRSSSLYKPPRFWGFWDDLHFCQQNGCDRVMKSYGFWMYCRKSHWIFTDVISRGDQFIIFCIAHDFAFVRWRICISGDISLRTKQSDWLIDWLIDLDINEWTNE